MEERAMAATWQTCPMLGVHDVRAAVAHFVDHFG
jgi:hypothetical protein